MNTPPESRAPSPGDPTEHLLLRIHAGDRSAENTLFERYTERVLQLVRRKLGQPLRTRIESMDLVQEALAEAYAKIGAFDPRGEGAFLRWVKRIVDRKVLEAYRHTFRSRRSPRKEAPLEADLAGDFPTTEAEDLLIEHAADRLISLLHTLKDAHRDALILRYFEGLDAREMAARMDRSPDACRVLVARALAALERRLRRSEALD